MSAAQDVIAFVLVLTVIGVLGGVGIYINEKVSDKTALVSGDHFYNASEDMVDTVETGWDFTEIIVLAIAAGIILMAVFGVIGGFIRI